MDAEVVDGIAYAVGAMGEGVATITLAMPARLNPLALPMQRRMLELLAGIHQDRSVRALVVTGEGAAFCVGADLQAMRPGAGDARPFADATADLMAGVSNPLILALRELPVPTLAAVNGAVAGAGVGLALACDIVIAARSAYFYLPFMSRLGIVPDLGTTWFLPRLVGRARASALTLLGERLPAEEAAQWGLIAKAVEDDGFPAAVREAANRLAALPAHAALETRRVYDAAEANGLAAQLRHEAERQRELLGGEAFAEGVTAFLGKRAPAFNGR